MALYEIGIAVADRGPGRMQEGDIVVARKPLGYVGRNEEANLLWLVVESDFTIEELEEGTEGRKRDRFVDLGGLGLVGLTFDLAMVRDEEQRYQPGLDPDPVTGVFRRSPVPVPIDSLIRRRS